MIRGRRLEERRSSVPSLASELTPTPTPTPTLASCCCRGSGGRRRRLIVALLLLGSYYLSIPVAVSAEDGSGESGGGGGGKRGVDSSAGQDAEHGAADMEGTSSPDMSGTTTDANSDSSSSAADADAPLGKKASNDGNDDGSEPEKHWGTFYDPQNVFCGEYDCYKILGFDHETWGDSPPDTKLITRSYRQLSRRWHPDKNRGRRAKDRFVVRPSLPSPPLHSPFFWSFFSPHSTSALRLMSRARTETCFSSLCVSAYVCVCIAFYSFYFHCLACSLPSFFPLLFTFGCAREIGENCIKSRNDHFTIAGIIEALTKINRAYEILTNEAKRDEYDFLRDRPDEYFAKYGSNVLYKYAPKSDVIFVALLLLAIMSAFTWFAQKQKWQNVADRLIQASVEGWSIKDGGTDESLDIRDRAMEKLAEKKKLDDEGGEEEKKRKAGGAPTPKKKERLTNKEKRLKEQEELRPYVVEIVNEMRDFGAGHHQPTWRDLLVVRLIMLPPALFRAVLWQSRYFARRIRGMPLNDEEREMLTRRAVGEVAWFASSDEDRKEMIDREVWASSQALEDWREWVEVRRLGPGYQKRYGRWKKKQGSKLDKDD